jgi:hypothetical protein
LRAPHGINVSHGVGIKFSLKKVDGMVVYDMDGLNTINKFENLKSKKLLTLWVQNRNHTQNSSLNLKWRLRQLIE